jgi:uncharacterized membrane protein
MVAQSLERQGLYVGSAVGLAGGLLVFLLPNPSNIVALRALGSPLLFVVGALTLVIPPAGLLYYVVVPLQWTLVGWLVGFLVARRRRRASSQARGT